MTATAEISSPWLVVAEAAQYARTSPDEIRDALGSGELRGSQRKPGGRWRVHRDDLDAWLRGERQPVQIPAVTRRPHTSGAQPAGTAERGR